MPALQSWIAIEKDSPFSLANIPFGIIAFPSDPAPRPAVAIGRYALDLKQFADAGGFVALPSVAEHHLAVFSSPTLNGFAALGREVHQAVRSYLQDVMADDTQHPELLKNNARLRQAALVPLDTVQMRLPLAVGDYTDFYAGRHHAYNVGVLFRGAQNALQPNYDYLPVAYHGRASSVVVSGTPLRRPWGQQLLPDPNAAAPKVPVLAPCAKLDYEVELAAFICQENKLGVPVAVREAESFLFGYVLVIDWSARDIQAWEYVPLGPFTSKNFGTSISPWVVLADALEPFKTAGLPNDKKLSAYLLEDNDDDETEAQGNVFNIDLEVDVISSRGHAKTVSKTNAKYLLWSFPQMIAHHTITGCNLRPGDLLASGTISGPSSGSEGSLLEQTQGGKVAIDLGGGEQRRFLEDGDTVVIRGQAGFPGSNDGSSGLVGFGEVRGRVEAVLPLF